VLSVSCDLCALCDQTDSGSFFVSFSTLLVPLEVETFLYSKEVGSHWSHGAHGAVRMQSRESIQQLKKP
jgi:hypothetical protein